jgi:AraC-like DNA-binding protein
MSRDSIPVHTLHDLAPEIGGQDFELKRLEDAFNFAKKDVVSAHRHDYYEVFWIIAGRGANSVDFQDYTVRPHTLCFISPGQVHAWSLDRPAAGYLLSFTGEFFSASPEDQATLLEMPFFYTVGSSPVLHVSLEQASVFTDLCQKIEREYQLTPSRRDQMLRAYLRILLIEAERLHDASTTAPHKEESGFLLTKRFLLLVESHLLTTSSVADYAAMLHVTTNHLVETVKRTMGKPAGKFIRERLVLEAKRLLRYSELSVSEIAYRLNFDDPSYFSRFFKKHAGLTPLDFRSKP